MVSYSLPKFELLVTEKSLVYYIIKLFINVNKLFTIDGYLNVEPN